jgi:hypothetical protein
MISNDEATRICDRLAECAGELPTYELLLESRGIRTFRLYQAYLEGYCATPAEVCLHREISVEMARQLLGTPRPRRLDATGMPIRYQSPLIARLEAQRDRSNGVPFKDLAIRFPGEPWRKFIDPAMAGMFSMIKLDNAEYTRRHGEYESAKKIALLNETAELLSDRGEIIRNKIDFDSDNIPIYMGIVVTEFERLGYFLDKKQSNLGNLLIKKEIDNSGIEIVHWIEVSITDKSCNSGLLQYHCILSSKEKRVASQLKSNQALVLPIEQVIRGFGQCYMEFVSINNLYLNVIAYISLYNCFRSAIEEGVLSAL